MALNKSPVLGLCFPSSTVETLIPAVYYWRKDSRLTPVTVLWKLEMQVSALFPADFILGLRTFFAAWYCCVSKRRIIDFMVSDSTRLTIFPAN